MPDYICDLIGHLVSHWPPRQDLMGSTGDWRELACSQRVSVEKCAVMYITEVHKKIFFKLS
jgi:hypothetical protein